VARVRQLDESPVGFREATLPERIHSPRVHALGVWSGLRSHRHGAGSDRQRQAPSTAPSPARPRRRTCQRYRGHRHIPLRTASRGAPRSTPRWRCTSQRFPG
jgi:hypothetical protein